MENLLSGSEEDFNYLTNYWTHAVGSYVKKSGQPAKMIRWIDEKYLEQIGLVENLEDGDKVYFIQDFDWVPTTQDLDRVVGGLGIAVLKDGLQYRKTFQAKPTTLGDYANAIRGFRLVSLAHNDDLLKKVKG